MGLTASCQKVKKVTVNRQIRKILTVNRQPSINSVMINRQTSFIMDYYSVRQWC